jgi:hypothetical protein
MTVEIVEGMVKVTGLSRESREPVMVNGSVQKRPVANRGRARAGMYAVAKLYVKATAKPWFEVVGTGESEVEAVKQAAARAGVV